MPAGLRRAIALRNAAAAARADPELFSVGRSTVYRAVQRAGEPENARPKPRS